MDYRKLTDADLVDFSKNLAVQLTGSSVTGIDTELATALAAALTPLNTNYETAIEQGVQKTAAKESAIAGKQAFRDEVIAKLSTVRNHLVAAESPKSAYEICGFTFPKAPSTVIANAPSDLAAVGTSNGVNSLTFTGNNKAGSVVYEIWRRQGDEGVWAIIASIKKQVFDDTPVTPGQYYEYKVRAVAATNTSAFSNSAVVYGKP